MSHPLEQKIARLRRREKCWAAVHGLSAVAAVALGAVVALGSIDRLLRLEDRGVRIIVSLAALGVLAWSCRRFLGSTWFARLTDFDLARRVQRAFPQLHDGLLSAVEFLRRSDEDPTAGSASLRQAIIAETATRSQGIDFSQVLDRRPAARAVAILAAACLVAGVLAWRAPVDAWTAVVRLANPFGGAAWPRTTHLAARRPVARVARGQPFEIEVIDAHGARLPPEVRIHYRTVSSDGVVVEEVERMRPATGAMIARRENVQRPFSYWVEGGDDRSMPWTDVEVVEPPMVDVLTLRLIPPAYTGWPAVASERDVRALAGTEVRMIGRANKPLASAWLCLEQGDRIPAELSADGVRFTIGYGSAALVLQKSGAYWFELVDREGFRGGTDDRWPLRVIADAPPSMRIEQPTANLFVGPRAVVPVRISAKDDIALSNIALVFRRGDSGPEVTRPLFTGPKRAPRQASATAADQNRTVDDRWDLGPLELQPGAQITFWATAGDYLPQTGKSEPRQLIVVTPDELQDRIANREKLILSELKRALAMQRACRSQVAALTARLAETRPIRQNDVDSLQTAEHAQREVRQLLTGRGEGVPMHVLGLLADLENNRLDSDDARRQMTAMIEWLDRLDREHLRTIDRRLATVVKTVETDREAERGTGGSKSEAVAGLNDVGKRQEVIVAALEQWLDALGRWESSRGLQREIEQLLRDQEAVSTATAALGRRTVSRDLRDLSSQDATALKEASGSQRELARRLDRALEGMEQAGAALRTSDPEVADTLTVALDEARRQTISGEMRRVGDQIRENQMGQAAAGQRRIAGGLREILDILVERRRPSAARLEDDLKRLRGRQETALEDVRRMRRLEESQGQLTRQQAAAVLDLARDQRSIEADAARLGKQFSGAGAFGLAIGRAATDMGRAAAALDRREIGTGTQEAQSDAIRRLGYLLEALKPEQPAGKAEGPDGGRGDRQSASSNQIPGIAQLKLLKLIQQEINVRTDQLQESLAAGGRAAETAVGDCAELGRQEGQLAETLGKPTETEENELILEIVRQMREVEYRLSQSDPGSATRQTEKQIVADLDRLLEQIRKGAVRRISDTARRSDAPPSEKTESADRKPGSQPAQADAKRPSDEGPTGDKTPATDTQARIKRLWGMLPEQARQQMQQLPPEKFPPKYEFQIEEYFRRLAEAKDEG